MSTIILMNVKLNARFRQRDSDQGENRRSMTAAGRLCWEFYGTALRVECRRKTEIAKKRGIWLMKTVLGFNRSEEKENRAACEGGRIRTNAPVKSLARIRFPEKGGSYTYYNDRFDLRKGDLVFVSGKLAGVPGFVEAVNYKFKIDLADYELVIACPEIRISGSYIPVLDKMVSCDPHAVRPDTFRSWVRPPLPDGEEPPEFVTGEGYGFELEHFTDDDDADPAILGRALDYCGKGLVRYLSVRDGGGTAFVEGTKWYEVNFRFSDGNVSDMYCECPYPGLCKHNLAVLFNLRELVGKLDREDFTAIDSGYFFRMLSISGQRITVDADGGGLR